MRMKVAEIIERSRGDAEPPKAAAYVRMSTDKQEYSPANQLDRITEYAALHGIEIVRVYKDAGRSGLTMEGRPALMQLMEDVQARQEFSRVLVYDVTRWGRFQDTDESAYCEVHCRRHGVSVLYCAENFSQDGTIYADIQKLIARAGAAKFSRDLSVKVFDGQCRLIRMGFKAGGPAGYGLRRMLLASDGTPVCILEYGDHKFLQNQHVVLVPGPPEEIATVNQIFKWYAEDRVGDRRIALVLNANAIARPDGRHWTPDIVRYMLKSEKYIGNLIFNKASFKLQRNAVRNPPESWVRCDAAFPAIVPPALFEAAQRERTRRYRRYSADELLVILRTINQRHGKITSALIDQDPCAPTSKLIANHFGSLVAAYAAAGAPPGRDVDFIETRRRVYKIRDKLQLEVEGLMRQTGATFERLPSRYSLRLNGKLTVSIRTLACRHELVHGYVRWQGPTPGAVGVDYILAAQLNPANTAIERYLLISVSDFDGLYFEFTPKGLHKFKIQSTQLADLFGLRIPSFIC